MELSITEMFEMQRELWEKHKDSWSPLEAEFARDSLLWMIEEVGEVISVIKKKGEKDIMENEHVRAELVTELADVMMYLNDTMIRFGVTPEEISLAYARKHASNMGRDFESEYEKLYK